MRKIIVLITGILMLLSGCCLVIVVSQPCSGLDLALNYTGCIRQLDIGADYNGVFSRDLTMFGGGTTNGISIWRVNDGRLLHTIPGSNGVFSPDGVFFISDSNSHPSAISVWSTQDWTLQTRLDTGTEIVTDIAIASDLSSLAVADRTGLVQIWQTSDRKLLHNLEARADYVFSIAYSTDGTLLASGGRDKTIRLWRVEDGKLLYTLEGTVAEEVVFAPDGLTFASANGDGTVQIRRTNDGALLYTLKGHNADVRDITYSPDSSILASADSRGVVQLWDVNRGTQLRTLRQNWVFIGVYAVAFSPDGKLLATAQRYGPVRLYDMQQLLGGGTN